MVGMRKDERLVCKQSRQNSGRRIVEEACNADQIRLRMKYHDKRTRWCEFNVIIDLEHISVTRSEAQRCSVEDD